MENNLDAAWRECKRKIYTIRLHDKSAELRRVALMEMGRAIEQAKAARIKVELESCRKDNELTVACAWAKVWCITAAISWLILAIGGVAYVIL